MRGIDEYNYPAFNEAAQHIREMGFEVINPAESFDGRTDLDWHTYMRKDVEDLLNVDFVVVLPGWENSQGARVEVTVAYALGLPVTVYEPGHGFTKNLDVSWLVTPDKVTHPEQGSDRNQETVLQEAQRIVYGARQKDYGHPIEDFTRTAQMWTAIIGHPITAEDVALMMVALKISRLKNTPSHRDSIVDIAGYAGTYELVRQKREEVA